MPDGSRLATKTLCLAAVGIFAACISTNFVATGVTYPSNPPDCRIKVYTAAAPDREFEELGVIEADGSGRKSSLEDILPKLKEEACLVGGDALVLQSAQRYQTNSDGVRIGGLFTVATVIRWTEAR